MKRVFLGFLSIFFAGLISFAQPVSDMAVIPMGITVQSVMRLNVTKGGNIEFVFKSGADVTAGIPSGGYGATYETSGTITASQNWDLNLTVDETDFIADNGAAVLPLNVVSFNVTSAGIAAGTTLLTDTQLAQGLVAIDDNGVDNLGDAIDFQIQWACGVPALASASIVGTLAGRYSANIILSLVPVP